MSATKCLDFTDELKLIQNTEQKLKGVIVDNDSNVVVHNFCMPTEYTLGKNNAIIFEEISFSFPTTLYKYVEGTSIRVYRWNEKWRISTTSRLDAFTSFWSTPSSFGSLFSKLLTEHLGVPTIDDFFNLLDPHKIYFYLLPTTGTNRIGTLHDVHKLFLVAIQEGSKLYYGKELPKESSTIWEYLEEFEVSGKEELERFLSISTDQTDGFLWFPLERDNRIVKFVTEKYLNRCKLRDNQANILFRYLQLKKKGDTEGCEKLREMYSNSTFEELDNTLERLSRYLHKLYISRYVHKEYVIVNRQYYSILKRIHSLYISNRVPTVVNRVTDVILENDARLILSLLRKFSNPT